SPGPVFLVRKGPARVLGCVRQTAAAPDSLRIRPPPMTRRTASLHEREPHPRTIGWRALRESATTIESPGPAPLAMSRPHLLRRTTADATCAELGLLYGGTPSPPVRGRRRPGPCRSRTFDQADARRRRLPRRARATIRRAFRAIRRDR